MEGISVSSNGHLMKFYIFSNGSHIGWRAPFIPLSIKIKMSVLFVANSKEKSTSKLEEK
jgi:hypothetical protein